MKLIAYCTIASLPFAVLACQSEQTDAKQSVSAHATRNCFKPQPGHANRPRKKCREFRFYNREKCFQILLVNNGGHVDTGSRVVSINKDKYDLPLYELISGWAYLVGDVPVIQTNIVEAQAEGSAIAVKKISDDVTRVALYSSSKGKGKLRLIHGNGIIEEKEINERTWVDVTRGSGGMVTKGPETAFDPSVIPSQPTSDFDIWRKEIEDDQAAEEVP